MLMATLLPLPTMRSSPHSGYPSGSRVGRQSRRKTALLFETYPKRHGMVRQTFTHIYDNDTVVVNNGYVVENYTDRAGNTSTHYIRFSQTWVKIGTEWKIVDQHASRMPIQ
jgi:hypothetical protein